MSVIREVTAADFSVFQYDTQPFMDDLRSLALAGKVPIDTAFRLASIGEEVVDPSDEDTYLRWRMLWEVLGSDGDTSQMSLETARLLEGPPPDSVIDYDLRHNTNMGVYRELPDMYYRLGNLANIIKERRTREGKSQEYTSANIGKHIPKTEWGVCVGLARKVWQVAVRCVNSESLDSPLEYRGARISFLNVYRVGEASARRSIIAHTVIKDEVLLSFYERVRDEGIKGIGKVGVGDLRALLADQYFEPDEAI